MYHNFLIHSSDGRHLMLFIHEALMLFSIYVCYQYKLLLCRNRVVYAGVEEQPKLGRSREDLTEVSI